VAPGRSTGTFDSTGLLTLDGSYAQNDTGSLFVEIGGIMFDTGVGGLVQYDRLTVTGEIELEFGTTFAVNLLDDIFHPKMGDFFDILTGIGLFNWAQNPLLPTDITRFQFTGTSLGDHRFLVPSFVDFDGNSLVDRLRLTFVVPEPSVIWLLALGLGLMGLAYKAPPYKSGAWDADGLQLNGGRPFPGSVSIR
jgi:hypothetical protein